MLEIYILLKYSRKILKHYIISTGYGFCIPYENLQKYLQPTQNKTLYVKRKDKELCKENISFSPLFNLLNPTGQATNKLLGKKKD